MGVAGCGKSTIAARLAQATGCALVEGDDFHPAENIRKMREGVGLTDADRYGWLQVLGQHLQAHAAGVVLSCSALKRIYRDQLRAQAPGLRFVFLRIAPELALQRVAARGASHFFTPSLVANQFATLEDPSGEDGVLAVEAAWSADEITARALAWLRASPATPSLQHP